MRTALIDCVNLTAALREFAAARDWERFHSPKNLVMALTSEVGELTEHFQWLTEEQSSALNSAHRMRVGEELADILIYLVRLADALGIDMDEVTRRKLAANAAKYPTDLAKGNALKYSELDPSKRRSEIPG